MEGRRKPLANEIMSIKESCLEDPFVCGIIKSLSDEALYNGCYTEEDLKARFQKVYRLGWRFSRIGDNGGSLLQYVWSWLQSLLVIDLGAASKSEEIDPAKIDTFGVLSRARHYAMEKEDMENAVRLLLLLRGNQVVLLGIGFETPVPIWKLSRPLSY